MSSVTDTHRRMLYLATEAEPLTSTLLQHQLRLTPAQLSAVTADAIAAGWLVALPGLNHHGLRYRAVIRPPCCTGGYRPPGPTERVPPYELLRRQRAVQQQERTCT